MPDLYVIPGDGIGKEVIPSAVRVLLALIPDLNIVNAEAGWDVFQNQGTSVPERTFRCIREYGSALFGAVSSSANNVPGYQSVIIRIRQELDLYANIRPEKACTEILPLKMLIW